MNSHAKVAQSGRERRPQNNRDFRRCRRCPRRRARGATPRTRPHRRFAQAPTATPRTVSSPDALSRAARVLSGESRWRSAPWRNYTVWSFRSGRPSCGRGSGLQGDCGGARRAGASDQPPCQTLGRISSSPKKVRREKTGSDLSLRPQGPVPKRDRIPAWRARRPRPRCGEAGIRHLRHAVGPRSPAERASRQLAKVLVDG